MTLYCIHRIHWIALFTGLFVVGGCSFNSDYAGTEYRCSDGVSCPSGYRCNSGVCEATGATPADAGPPGDAVAAPDANPGATACSTTDLLSEDFDDGLGPETLWYSYSNSMELVAADGRLEATPELGADEASSGFESMHYYYLRDSTLSLEVPDYDPASRGAIRIVGEAGDPTNGLEIQLVPGTLRFSYFVAGVKTTVGEVPYDATLHRYWRIREGGGKVFWETSSDAQEWVEHTQAPSAPFDEPMRIKVQITYPAGLSAPLPVFADNINTDAVPNSDFCPASSFSDDFEDSTPGLDWLDWYEGECELREENGALTISFPVDGAGGACTYASGVRYDFTDQSVSVEVPSVDSSGDLSTFLYLLFPDGSEIGLSHGSNGDLDDVLTCFNRLAPANAQPCIRPYDAEEARWWRVRHDAADATLHWEISGDGAFWVGLASAPDGGFELNNAYVLIGSNTLRDLRTVENIQFDNLNRTSN